MKKLYSRTSAAVACALCVAACGGGSGNLTLGGTVTGMTKTGLTLTNNGGTPLVIQPNVSTFYFPDLIGSDEKYDVQIKDLPEGAKCVPTYNTGRTGAYNVTSVRFDCYNVPRDLGGTIDPNHPLKNAGLILNNGQVQLPVGAGATEFTFTQTTTNAAGVASTAGQVGDGEPFGVTVLQQPSGQTCTVSNGSGYMGHVNFKGVVVSCTP